MKIISNYVVPISYLKYSVCLNSLNHSNIYFTAIEYSNYLNFRFQVSILHQMSIIILAPLYYHSGVMFIGHEFFHTGILEPLHVS